MTKNKRQTAKRFGFDDYRIKVRLSELGEEPKKGRLVWKDKIGGDVEFIEE